MYYTSRIRRRIEHGGCVHILKLSTIYHNKVHLLPKMDDIMDYLSGAKYFKKIDLKSGYH